MTQKANLFKGQQKKKSVPLNRHGKASLTRKGTHLCLCVYVFVCVLYINLTMCVFFFGAGKRNVKPSKVTKEMDVDRVCPIFPSLFSNTIFIFIYLFWVFCMLGMLGFRLMGSVM